jgi:hypothetical protein
MARAALRRTVSARQKMDGTVRVSAQYVCLSDLPDFNPTKFSVNPQNEKYMEKHIQFIINRRFIPELK